MRATRFFLFMFFFVFQVSKIHARASSDLVKNTTEQLNFLYEHNKTQIVKGNIDKMWYIYFLGANKIELELPLARTLELSLPQFHDRTRYSDNTQ
ncbi:Putative exported protein [Zobellia galactanivorans]|uniref:Putative exported protein n=1 Tax=Zobellia galactanivorans (strain DSM 12802 / CCUG 47099 / CIP 106680 / NCIMB 13871 / Dsij) TaxID=63186 RepID=G0L3T7_ZOBGA|nr:Putative exported protein [Zobellia galactanivorans]